MNSIKRDPELLKEWKHLDHPTRPALAQQSLTERGQSLHLISRYETRLRRQYDKALQNLYLVQSKRRRQQAKSDAKTRFFTKRP